MNNVLQILELGTLRALRGVSYVVAILSILIWGMGCVLAIASLFYGEWQTMWVGLMGWCLLGPAGWIIAVAMAQWSWSETHRLNKQGEHNG